MFTVMSCLMSTRVLNVENVQNVSVTVNADYVRAVPGCFLITPEQRFQASANRSDRTIMNYE